MLITKFAACIDKDGHGLILKVRFKAYLPNNGWDEAFVEGSLMLRGYHFALLFEDDSVVRFIKEEQCILVELDNE